MIVSQNNTINSGHLKMMDTHQSLIIKEIWRGDYSMESWRLFWHSQSTIERILRSSNSKRTPLYSLPMRYISQYVFIVLVFDSFLCLQNQIYQLSQISFKPYSSLHYQLFLSNFQFRIDNILLRAYSHVIMLLEALEYIDREFLKIQNRLPNPPLFCIS